MSVTIHGAGGLQLARAYSVGLDMVAVSLPFFLRVEGSGDGRVFVASGRGSCTFCRFERRADEVEDWSPWAICCAGLCSWAVAFRFLEDEGVSESWLVVG